MSPTPEVRAEFEAIISTPDEEQDSRRRLALLAEALGVRHEHRIPVSYSDLLGL